MKDSHPKDESAEKLIRKFVDKLLKLGGGRIPHHWEKLLITELHKVAGLAALSAILGLRSDRRAAQTGTRRPGRPTKWSDDFKERLVNAINARKAALSGGSDHRVTDREALEHFLLNDISISQRDLPRTVSRYIKILSRARPPSQRRKKRPIAPHLRGRRWQ